VHLDLATVLISVAAVLVGSIVQGTIGFGLNLLAAPIVAIVAPEMLPFSLVLVALLSSVTNVVRERHEVDRVAVRRLLIGAVPGTIVGLLLLSALSSSGLAVAAGAVTLIGVGLSAFSPPLPINVATSVTAGFVSNAFGTAVAIGGPPVALLFQHHRGPTMRSTLGAFFATSAVLSIAAYALAGELHGDQALFALALLPALVLGMWISRHLHQFVDRGWLRPSVLVLSALAGAIAIVDGLA
jgi:uncharacterized membrane protein YfcA